MTRPFRDPPGWSDMTYTNTMHRSGMTAIAAVLALSSTPLFAQDATVSQPVVATPTTTAPNGR